MKLPESDFTFTKAERERHNLRVEVIKTCHAAIFSTYKLLVSSEIILDLEKMLYDAELLANHIYDVTDNCELEIGDICSQLRQLSGMNDLIIDVLKKTEKAISYGYGGEFNSNLLEV